MKHSTRVCIAARATWVGMCGTPALSTEASIKNESTLYVGLDVHKESLTVAYVIGGGDVESMGKIGTTPTEIDRLCKRLQSKASKVRVVYEAGPCGYGLHRRLANMDLIAWFARRR